MAERYKPIAFEERPSQHVGLKNLAHEAAPVLGISALGAAGGWLAGKARIIKVSPAITATVGGKISGIVSAFLIWRKKEKALVGVEDVYEKIKQVESLHRTDDDLKRDNRALEKMIAYEKNRREQPGGSHAESIAAKSESEREDTARQR